MKEITIGPYPVKVTQEEYNQLNISLILKSDAIYKILTERLIKKYLPDLTKLN